eukprot:gene26575-biopygen16903
MRCIHGNLWSCTEEQEMGAYTDMNTIGGDTYTPAEAPMDGPP